jgi:hypothetical protein
MTTAFCYDPDFRRSPKDPRKPYCCRCQQNVNSNTAVAVTINEETWMAVEGHGNPDPVSRPDHKNKVIGDAYLGKDCYEILKRNAVAPANARSLLK